MTPKALLSHEANRKNKLPATLIFTHELSSRSENINNRLISPFKRGGREEKDTFDVVSNIVKMKIYVGFSTLQHAAVSFIMKFLELILHATF